MLYYTVLLCFILLYTMLFRYSFARAATTSFGPICMGSLLGASVAVTRYYYCYCCYYCYYYYCCYYCCCYCYYYYYYCCYYCC